MSEVPYTPLTDSFEMSLGGNPPAHALTAAIQLARALEQDRVELVAVLGRFASLDKTVNSDRWAIDPEYCARARAVIAGLLREPPIL
jgi:hypothetical protein